MDTRTDAGTVRALLPTQLVGLGPIVQVGQFVSGTPSTYAAFPVVCQITGEEYSTHLAVYNDEKKSWFAINGDYNLTLDAATDDLKTRN